VRRVTAAGTVNAIFRVGEGLAARFPLHGLVWHYAASNPPMSRLGRRALGRLLAR
jgi:hypothetical protein